MNQYLDMVIILYAILWYFVLFGTEENIILHRFRSKVRYLGLKLINSLEFRKRYIPRACKLAKEDGARKRDEISKDLQRYESKRRQVDEEKK